MWGAAHKPREICPDDERRAKGAEACAHLGRRALVDRLPRHATGRRACESRQKYECRVCELRAVVCGFGSAAAAYYVGVGEQEGRRRACPAGGREEEVVLGALSDAELGVVRVARAVGSLEPALALLHEHNKGPLPGQPQPTLPRQTALLALSCRSKGRQPCTATRDSELLSCSGRLEWK